MSLDVKPAFETNNIAIVFQSSDYYAPYTSVTIQSIIDNMSENNNYDIIVTSLDMTAENTRILEKLSEQADNVSVRVINVSAIHRQYPVTLEKGRFGGETITRVFLPEILINYDKVISMDSDMIVRSDIVELYGTDIDRYYMGAVKDIMTYYTYATVKTHYFVNAIDNVLKINDPLNYHNAGILLLNIKKIREDFTSAEIINYINDNSLKFLEQDAFNHFFHKKIYTIDIAWNYAADISSVITIGTFKKLNIDLYNEYLGGGKRIKNIHFLTVKKPWDNPNIPQSDLYWEVARRTPYYELILFRMVSANPEKINKSIFSFNNSFLPTEFNNNRKILFLCETIYQLINVINLKMTTYKFYRVDLLLTQSTDFSEYIDKLKQTELFNDIQVVEYAVLTHRKLWADAQAEDSNYFLNNLEDFLLGFECKGKYTDFFIPVDYYLYYKIVYYFLVKVGCAPKIHIYEDGMATYMIDIAQNQRNDGLNHNIYGSENNYLKNIVEVLVYEPILVSVPNIEFPVNKIPKISSPVVEVLELVFGKCEMPKEKYIYLDEPSAIEGRCTSEIDYLNIISSVVGKENIIVKFHPRNKIDMFSANGYKVMESSPVPWEIYLAKVELKNKVFLTMSSGACIAGKMVYNKDFNAIMMYELMVLSRRAHLKQKYSNSYYNKLDIFCNQNRKNLFTPKTVHELKLAISYIEGRMSIDE